MTCSGYILAHPFVLARISTSSLTNDSTFVNMNTTQQLTPARFKSQFPIFRSIVKLVESVHSPSPALLFTAAIGLYTTLCILEDYYERLYVAVPIGDSTELSNASLTRDATAEGLELDQTGLQARSEDTAWDLSRPEASEGETDFADVEVNTRRFPTSILVKQISSSQNVLDDIDQLMRFSDLDSRLINPQIWFDFAPRSLDLQVLDESSEQACPQTPRLSFADYPATPDSGYYSHASPRSMCEAISPLKQSDDSRYRDVVDMHLAPEELKSLPNLCVPSRKVPKPGRRSAISLGHLADCVRTTSSIDLDITVLDVDTGLRVPLSTALSTKDMRRRTGILLSLRTVDEERELRVRELIPWDKLGSIKANISIWDDERETFRNLSTVLMKPETRSRANVYIERCLTQLNSASSQGHPMSWLNLVGFLDISGFFFGQMQSYGVDLRLQVDNVMEESTKLCIRTKVAAQ
jgi:hypothetical protein